MSVDGVTPRVGVPVVLSVGAGSGAVQFAACGATASCSVVTDANGRVSSLVTGRQVGAVTLMATAQLVTGSQTASAPMQVLANVLSVSALEPQMFVAEGATVAMELDVAGGWRMVRAAAGQMVIWTGASFVFSGESATTDASGWCLVAGGDWAHGCGCYRDGYRLRLDDGVRGVSGHRS